MQKRRAFTLIELLIVIGLIAILAGVVFVALDPLTRFRDARNSRRFADVSSMLTAIRVHQVDNKGPYTASVQNMATNQYRMIGSGGVAGCTIACNATTGADIITNVGAEVGSDDCVDLGELATLGYLGSVPVSQGDPPGAPTEWSSLQSGYYINKLANNAITIGACDNEGGGGIEVIR